MMTLLFWLIAALAGYCFVGVLALFTLWVLFIAAMNMQKSREELSPGMVKFCGGVVATWLIFDVLCNLLFAWAVMADPTRKGEWTVSQRLQRLVLSARWSWQTRLARWFAEVAMNPFCKKGEPHIKLTQPGGISNG